MRKFFHYFLIIFLILCPFPYGWWSGREMWLFVDFVDGLSVNPLIYKYFNLRYAHEKSHIVCGFSVGTIGFEPMTPCL